MLAQEINETLTIFIHACIRTLGESTCSTLVSVCFVNCAQFSTGSLLALAYILSITPDGSLEKPSTPAKKGFVSITLTKTIGEKNSSLLHPGYDEQNHQY